MSSFFVRIEVLPQEKSGSVKSAELAGKEMLPKYGIKWPRNIPLRKAM
jgi:hypothetical protein